MPSVPSLLTLPVVCMHTNLHVFNFLSLRCIGLFTVNKLKDALYTRSKLCIKQSQQSSFEQGFNIHAGSIIYTERILFIF